MPTSEEDLQKIRQENESLLMQVADENQKRAQAEHEASLEIQKVQLLAEQDRLKQELETARLATEAVANAIPAADQKTAYELMLEEQQKTQDEADKARQGEGGVEPTPNPPTEPAAAEPATPPVPVSFVPTDNGKDK